MDTRPLETLRQQAEALTAALHKRQMQTEAGTPEGDRLRRMVKRATQRAERRYQASFPRDTL
jgi:hypothetical protein